MKKISVSLFVALPMLLAASGCEISTCEGDECDFDSIFDEDAGGNGGSSDDGGNSGELDGGDNGAGGGDDGGGATGDGGGSGSVEVTTLEEFCTAQLAIGQAWADAFDTCLCPGDTAAARNNFLAFSLIYGGTSRCLDSLQPLLSGGKVSFVVSKAAACAEAFASQFEGPPAECPKLGFDLASLRSKIGHGASSLEQLTVCRQAFVGSVAKSQPCTEHLECADALRCLEPKGGGAKTCQAAIAVGEPCARFADCESGLICIGTTSSAFCQAGTKLGGEGVACSADRQCEIGRLCAGNLCTLPEDEVICE